MRTATLVSLGLFLLLPLAALLGEHLARASLLTAWNDLPATGGSWLNTLLLMGLAVLIAVPPGAAFAYQLCRRRIRGQRVLRTGVLAGLFIPLPVWAVSWQIILGEWLPPMSLEPGGVAWRPWKLGLLPAAWIHGVAAMPWVVVIVSLVLRTADPALEEEARQTGGVRGVWRWVILPRLAWAVFFASLVVALQAGTEIAVTDPMMVRTSAEEVYTQMVVRSTGLGAAIAATIPLWFGGAALLGLISRYGLRRFRASEQFRGVDPVARATHCASVLAWLPVTLYFGLPFGALVWKAAGGGVLAVPSAGAFAQTIEKAARTEWLTLVDSLAAAAAAGVFTAGSAWMACSLAFGSSQYRAALFGLCAILIAVPGPLAGFAIKEAIVKLVSAERSVLQSLDLHPDFPPLRSLLYDQPSPLPGIWVGALRFFPLACGIVAVAMHRIPKSLLETADAERRNFTSVSRWVIAPLTIRAFLLASVAVAALAFGEVSAGKLAQPPARGVFVLRLFDQMHYGAESSVAALCLLQSAATWGILWLLVGLRPERTP